MKAADYDHTELDLSADEQLIRSDLVNVGLSQLGSPRVAVMSLTSRGVRFSRPVLPANYSWKAWTIGLMRAPAAAMSAREKLRPALSSALFIEWNDILKIWRWEPVLSDAPFIQTSATPSFTKGSGFSYMLLTGELPRQKFAEDSAALEHLETVERNWREFGNVGRSATGL